MAANHEPYGLVPVPPQVGDEHALAKLYYSQKRNSLLDDAISTAVGNKADPSKKAKIKRIRDKIQHNDAQITASLKAHVETANYARPAAAEGQSALDNFLNCIHGAYFWRAGRRIRNRRLIHPGLVKAAVRIANREPAREEKEFQLNAINLIGLMAEKDGSLAQRVSEWLDNQRKDATVFQRYQEKIRNIPHPTGATPRTVRDRTSRWIRDYLLALVRRNCLFEEQEVAKKLAKADAGRSQHKTTTLLHELKAARKMSERLKEQLSTQIRNTAPSNAISKSPRSPDELCRDVVNSLMDGMREGDSTDVLRTVLQKLAFDVAILPQAGGAGGQLHGIAAGGSDTQLAAHTIQTWLLGYWLMEVAGGRQKLKEAIRDGIAEGCASKFQNVPSSARAFWQQQVTPDLIALAWAVQAVHHDRTLPLELLPRTLERFLKGFFTPALPSSSVERWIGTINVFEDRTLTSYKNLIQDLYDEQSTRDWIDWVFHHRISKQLDHALTAALLLSRRLFSPPAGRSMIDDLLRALRSIEEKNPAAARCLVAELAHALAFSHMTSIGQPSATNAQGQTHSGRTSGGSEFFVCFDRFPLTYLLALCEVLLDPFSDAELSSHQFKCADDVKRQLVGLSAFTISQLEIDSPDSDTTVLVTVRLWEDSLKEEAREVCSIRDIEALHAKYSQSNQFPVWDDKEFRSKRKSENEVDLTSDPPVIASGVMKILLLEARLKDFKRLYRCGLHWHFVVRFYNARDPRNKLYEVAL
jgi:hypothetical protein